MTCGRRWWRKSLCGVRAWLRQRVSLMDFKYRYVGFGTSFTARRDPGPKERSIRPYCTKTSWPSTLEAPALDGMAKSWPVIDHHFFRREGQVPWLPLYLRLALRQANPRAIPPPERRFLAGDSQGPRLRRFLRHVLGPANPRRPHFHGRLGGIGSESERLVSAAWRDQLVQSRREPLRRRSPLARAVGCLCGPRRSLSEAALFLKIVGCIPSCTRPCCGAEILGRTVLGRSSGKSSCSLCKEERPLNPLFDSVLRSTVPRLPRN